MSNYKQIAVMNIDGNLGTAFGDGIKNDLVASGRFQVIDRSHTNKILAEQHMSQNDLFDPKKSPKLGEMMGVQAVIVGHTEGSYNETSSSDRYECGSKKEGKKTCTTYSIEGVYSTSGSIDVIDVETGQTIKSKLLNATATDTSTATDERPAPIDSDALASSALSSNIASFMKSISPWKETVDVPFAKDDDIPDLERGINQIKMRDTDNAIKTFANAAKSAEGNPNIEAADIAKAYFNVGLCYNFTGDQDAAIAAFKKAYELNPDNDYLIWMQTAEAHKEERKKLKAQGAV